MSAQTAFLQISHYNHPSKHSSMFDSTCPLKSPTITSTKSLLISFLLICLLLLSNLPCPAESKSISSGSLAEAANSSSATLTATQQLLIDPSTSFARVYILPDGEVVSKLKWRNYTAIETRFSHLDLIQIIKEFQVVQLWLSNGELVDCEYTNDQHKVDAIQREFLKVNPNLRKDSKSFSLIEQHENFTTLPEHLKRLTEYDKFVHQCVGLHQLVREKFEQTKKMGKRSKREMMIFPGTKWCGKGSNNLEFSDLGDYSFADRCCRDHDRCKYSIGPFTSRYHLFNFRFHYVSHCSCDERFRSCLKVADSGAANLVGKIYFNVVQTKCFMFSIEDHCTETSWWGNCLNSKRRKRAVFRDPMTY